MLSYYSAILALLSLRNSPDVNSAEPQIIIELQMVLMSNFISFKCIFY